jgi:hypothetical protein
MPFDNPCPLCGSLATLVENSLRVDVSCLRCGEFSLVGVAIEELPRRIREQPIRASIMSHTLRRMQRPGEERIQIYSTDLPTYWSIDRLPTPKEQFDDLIRWIGDNQKPGPSSWAMADELYLDAWIGAALPTKPGNAEGLRWLVQHIEPDEQSPKFFHNRFERGKGLFQLTLPGWERHEALKQAWAESRIAFMAFKFGDPEVDRVVRDCFRRAVQRTGFELRDLQTHKRAGLIDNEIRASLLLARFVIADLTHGHDSVNVYWEAGFADGRGLPVIYSCERSKWDEGVKNHFNTNHMTTVLWDTNLESAEDELVSIIRTTLRAEAKQTD